MKIDKKELDEIALMLRLTDKLRMRKVWTLGYSPFIMGGDVHGPIGTNAPALGPFHVGHTYWVYLVLSPSGIVHVAELHSGAFVGLSLKEVRDDIRTGDVHLMAKQISDALAKSASVRMLEPKDFWSRFKSEREAAQTNEVTNAETT
jgi:hypothetical protein